MFFSHWLIRRKKEYVLTSPFIKANQVEIMKLGLRRLISLNWLQISSWLVADHMYRKTWALCVGKLCAISMFLVITWLIVHMQGCRPWGCRGCHIAMALGAPPDFGRSVNLMNPNQDAGGAYYAHHITQCSGKPIFFPVPVFTNFCIL